MDGRDLYERAKSNYYKTFPEGNQKEFLEMEINHQKELIKELQEPGTKRQPIEAKLMNAAKKLLVLLETEYSTNFKAPEPLSSCIYSIDSTKIVMQTAPECFTHFNNVPPKENEFDLNNKNVYSPDGELIKEANNPKDYDLKFAVMIKRTYPIYDCVKPLNRHYDKAPNKELFLKHIEYCTLLFDFLKVDQPEKCEFIKNWIADKRTEIELSSYENGFNFFKDADTETYHYNNEFTITKKGKKRNYSAYTYCEYTLECYCLNVDKEPALKKKILILKRAENRLIDKIESLKLTGCEKVLEACRRKMKLIEYEDSITPNTNLIVETKPNIPFNTLIFPNLISYEFFVLLKDKFVRQRYQLADFSFIYWYMLEDKLLNKVSPTDFRTFIYDSFNIELDKLKTKNTSETENKKQLYK
ncbi:MAG TPA: hypothetical protein VN026_07555, partial [Bacteroidia bacterium]|nr:hypothetical protein [Bacteroidia bacterium]